MYRTTALGVLLSLALGLLARADDATETESQTSEDFVTESLRGRVVWLADALQRHYGIKTMADASERILALETPAGQMFPIVEDLRGRSFRKDKRLRDMTDVELLVRRYANPDVIQVIRIYEFQNGKKYIVDYWCDICAIVMFEDGPCDCCQDHNRLRKRVVE